MSLKGKTITLCLTGAISAYKGLELARLLIKEGARVRPVMTASAERFVSALSLGVLAGSEVFSDVFSSGDGGVGGGYVRHIDLAQKTDLVVIAPATANIIGKLAAGIADCPVSLVAMAATAPLIIAPSMNTNMWENGVVQGNVTKLKTMGHIFVGPEAGELACGTTGMGRLCEPPEILEAITEALTEKDMAGERVLVTAGPTREYIDAVRFLSNASSSMMGYAIADNARKRGAEVRLISGPTCLACPRGVVRTKVTSALEMERAAMSAFSDATLVVGAAAVSDFYVEETFKKKIKKEASPQTLKLSLSPDILKKMGERKTSAQILIGFALETDNLLENAEKKLREKNLDMVAANGITAMESKANEATIITAEKGAGGVEKLPEANKREVARWILDRALMVRSRKPLTA